MGICFTKTVLFWSFAPAVPIVGGNCDNGAKCGRYLNVNTVAGNANWNIGASLYLPLISWVSAQAVIYPQCELISTALAEN